MPILVSFTFALKRFFVPTVIVGMLHNGTLVIGGASGFGEGTDCGSRFLPAHYEI